MLTNYVGVLFLFIFALILPALMITLSKIIAPSNPSAEKSSTYECGIEPLGDANTPQSMHFYVIAILFVIFDVETLFLFPWAISYDLLGIFGLIEMIIFIVILLVGFIYAWKKGALDWVS